MSDHDLLVQEQDKVDSKTVVGVGVAALVIFAVGIFWSISILRESNGTIRSYTPEQVPAGKQDEIGMVYQVSFGADFAAKLAAEQRGYLESTGWVDKAHGKVHIPIDRAILDYVEDAEKAGGKL